MGAAYANMHVYAPDEGPLDWWLSRNNLAKLKVANPDKPWFVTEWGHRIIAAKMESEQARNVLQGLLTHAQMGTAAHYLYALFDDSSGHYGLFNADGTPRQAAEVLRTFVRLTADEAPLARTAVVTVDLATTNKAAAIQNLVLPGPNRSTLHYLWTWNPPAKPFDYYWSLDRAVRVDWLSTADGSHQGGWSKRAGERQDWKGWKGTPVCLSRS